MSNRLGDETSPYLQQHAENPVHWWPWCDEAFEEARRRDVPVLLSVGYSACHWCHVMAHESFENAETAEVMNRLFVNVKVDREERPDIDGIYMQAVTSITGRGGWPMTVFLDPEGKPFFGGTYFPPVDRPGVPAFRSVLEAISDAWISSRDDVEEQAAALTRAIRPGELSRDGSVSRALLDEALGSIVAQFDPINGGFGAAPKFPNPMNLSFCLSMAFAGDTGDSSLASRAMQVVETSLRSMALGGIYDQIGGGFCRYSVDEAWAVPHFEKMLYDNAQLARLYIWAGAALESDFFRRIATETLDYLLRELHSADGAFYSSTDADSDGEEGAFFTWSYDELSGITDLTQYFGVTVPGNFEGRNVLCAQRPLEELDSSERADVLAAKEKLASARDSRVPPSLDDKIVCAWNALAISAFADAGRCLGRADYVEAAAACAEFVMGKMQANGILMRSWRDGRSSVPAFAQDYALTGLGLLSLFEATGDWLWASKARGLAQRLYEDFRDDADGLLLATPAQQTKLVAGSKDIFDNAEPGANSAGVELGLRIGALFGDDAIGSWAHETLDRFAKIIGRAPLGFGAMLSAVNRATAAPLEVVVMGDGPERDEMATTASRAYLPTATVVTGTANCPADTPPLLDGRLPATQATGYVCQNQVCTLPVHDAPALCDALKKALDDSEAGGHIAC